MNARRITWIIVGLLSISATTQALEPIAVLSPSDVPAGYFTCFGYSVAISGDYLVIGAPCDPYYDGDSLGAIYVFRRVGPNWVQQAKLFGLDAGFQPNFGYSVAIDGDVIVASAPFPEFGGCGGFHGRGPTYVFRRDDHGTPDDPNDDTWFEQAQLKPPDPQPYGQGASVAISGDVIVVGCACSQTLEVFRWNGSAWCHEASLTGSKMEGRFGFGLSVAVDRDRIIAGVYWNSGVGTGIAYVFAYNGTTWVEEDILGPSDHTTPDSFGTRVSIFGDYAVISAPGVNSAYVFLRNAQGNWEEQARLIISEGNLGGTAIDGDLTLVGSKGPAWGHLFRREEQSWVQFERLFGPQNGFAFPLALSGSYAAIGNRIYAVRNRRSLGDYAGFQSCFTGTTITELSPSCQSFDLNGDARVDLIDFEEFVGTFIGPYGTGYVASGAE